MTLRKYTHTHTHNQFSVVLGENKRMVCLRKTVRVNFLPLYPAGEIGPISVFPSHNLYNFFFVIRSSLILSIIVYLSSIHPPVYGRNISWEDTEDVWARTNNRSRWQVEDGCRISKRLAWMIVKTVFPDFRGTFTLPMRFFANKVYFLDRLSRFTLWEI